MKRLKSIAIILALALCFSFVAVGCTPNEPSESKPDDGVKITVTVGDKEFSATLADNETAKAFMGLLPLTLSMSEMNGNEKYNYLGGSLPANATKPGTIHAGDLMLYGSNCIVLFYETFSSSYSYTRIGWVDTKGLAAALGSGNVTVTFAASNTSGDEDPEEPDEPEQPSGTTQSLVFKKEGQSYTVTGMTGEEKSVVIPAEHDGLPVAKIQGEYGTGAFARKPITSVTIPDSVVEIGQNSFNNCNGLETVIISENSKLTTIGNNAFSGNAALKEFYLPRGMINLGDSVFNNCGAIERFIVADGNAAYSSENGHLIEKATATLMRGANNKEVPDGVKIIASAAFRKSTLKQLAIPATVEEIENYIIQDSAIDEIVFDGTEEQWEQIQKAKLWNVGNTDITIKYNISQDEEITEMYITINGKKTEVTLENNSSVTALVELLKHGEITYTADDYGGFEKVGGLGHTLPTNHTQLTTQPGDVILYQTNQIVLFYGSNSWSYTRIGKIKYSTIDELKSFLGAGQGSVQVTLSLK
ncbi:MAG: leucine-rich repeat protein [Clostridiales bacterium]|nr:leucine-rich repeat protein [Clostridiales bacterium]